jgi:hypothetical protein
MMRKVSGKKVSRAITQAVSRWLPTAAARVLDRVRSCDEQSGTGYLRVFRFPLPIFISPAGPQSLSSSIIRGWYNMPIVAAVKIEINLALLRIIIKKSRRKGLWYSLRYDAGIFLEKKRKRKINRSQCRRCHG